MTRKHGQAIGIQHMQHYTPTRWLAIILKTRYYVFVEQRTQHTIEIPLKNSLKFVTNINVLSVSCIMDA